MKKRLKSINPLLAFLLLSLIALFSFVGDYHYFLPKSNQNGFKYYVEPASVFEVIESSKGIKLKNYNSNFDLFYSVDGGETYDLYTDQNLNNIKMNDLTKYTTSIRYKHPFGEIPSLSSFLVKAKHSKKNIYTKPIHVTLPNLYSSEIPIFSLCVNESELFSSINGIMVLGKESWNDDGFYKPFWERSSNYKIRNNESKKQVYLQYIENDSIKYSTTCDIQISGNATRAFPQKSLKLKATKKYGGDKLKFPFFGDTELNNYKSIVLRNSGNDNTKTLFADLLMQNLASDFPVLTQKGYPVNVFINGNYWGIYNVRERYDSYFIGKKENVKPKKVTILEGGIGILKKGYFEESEKYVSFIDSIYNLKNIDKKTLSIISNYININSFSYYILIETFYGNGDWLNNNVMWYKADHKKWKWMLNDLDYGLAYQGNQNTNINYFNILQSSESITAKLYKTLMKNTGFKEEFKLKAFKLIEGFTNTKIEYEYDLLKHNFEREISHQTNRWRGNFSVTDWKKNCAKNLQFLLKRREIFIDQVEKL